MANQYYDGPEFQQGGKVAHQVDSKIKVDSMPTEKTLIQLKNQLSVDEEYEEAFEIARRLLKFYHSENPIRNGSCFAAAGMKTTQFLLALYFGLRCKNAPYLMIEISQFIGDDSVTKIAKCYLKLLKFVRMDVKIPFLLELSQNLQYLDPSIYIPKFVKALELRDKNQYEMIKETAIKLIKRMMLDWMAYGRRPSSLCGAALLISARFHGENVQTSKICQIVQVCDETIRKRLAEFNQTGLSQLTREQFEQIKNIENVPGPVNDPPSFMRLKQKEEDIKKSLTEEQYKELQENTLQKAMELIEILKIKPEIYQEDIVREQQIITKTETDERPTQVKEELSSLSEQEEQEYILTSTDRAYKQNVWNQMYKEYISDKNRKIEKKKNEMKKKETIRNSNQDLKKKMDDSKKKVKREYQCETPQESLEKTFGNDHINRKALDKLFTQQKEEDLLASFLGNNTN